MKLNKRDDILVTIWEGEKIVANDSNVVYAEINDNDIYILVKANDRDFKIKISKNYIVDNEQEQNT